MKYAIKEMSNLLGVTTHKLRYYEKTGIIQPEVNEQTGYRYYSVIDTRRFNLARLYRGMGFSVEECLSLLMDTTSGQVSDAIEQRCKELSNEVMFKSFCVERMERDVEFLKKIPDYLDTVSVIQMRSFARLEFSDNEKIVQDKKIIQLRDELLEYTPLIRWVSRIPNDILKKRSGTMEYHYGINIDLEYAKKLGLNSEEYVIQEGGTYLITVFKNESPVFGFDTLVRMQDYLKEHKITTFGNGYSSCIHSTATDGHFYNYHYLIVKID